MWSNLKVGKNVVSTLKNVVIAKAGSSMIIEGQEEVTDDIAIEYAKAINCNVNYNEPCDQCTSCTTSMTNNNPDIIIVKSEEGKKSIVVDQIRNLNKVVFTKPYREKFKVIIIQQAETMSVAAQNAILKVLEEPPQYVQFILLTRDSGQLLQTIRSRCLYINTYTLKDEEAKKMYVNTMSSYLYTVGAGEDLIFLNGPILRILEKYPKDDIIDILKDAEGISEQFEERLKDILAIMEIWIRDLLLAKKDGLDFLVNNTMQDKIKATSEQYTLEQITYIIEAISLAKSNLNLGCSKNTVLSALLLKLSNK